MIHFKAFAKLTAFSRLKSYINHRIGSKVTGYFSYFFFTPGFSVLVRFSCSIADCAFVIDCFTVQGHRLREIILSLFSGARNCRQEYHQIVNTSLLQFPFIVTKYCESISFRNVISHGGTCLLFLPAYPLQPSES